MVMVFRPQDWRMKKGNPEYTRSNMRAKSGFRLVVRDLPWSTTRHDVVSWLQGWEIDMAPQAG
jgi:hypothetical protein